MFQVEHNTNRAVIIDLGLAKFFRHGLNSAIDTGNPAYSAPEVLQRVSQRSQRSDVWAMGKIIAELCGRIRLFTPSVCPAKIKETLKDQAYCSAVCKMVEPDPSVRAPMASVISEIRRAGRSDTANNAPKKEHLTPPSSHITNRNRSPSPMIKDQANRAAPTTYKDLLPLDKDRSPAPLKWERTPRPAIKGLHAQTGLHHSPSPQRQEEKNKNQALVQLGRADVTQEMMKLKLHQEATKGLPCNLPVTGRVVVRRFEEKNGEFERWEQREVVTRDGKIVKYDDIKYDSK